MIDKFLKTIFGSRNDRLLKSYRAQVVKINALEPGLKTLSDDELRAKTVEFKQRIAAGFARHFFRVIRAGDDCHLFVFHFSGRC